MKKLDDKIKDNRKIGDIAIATLVHCQLLLDGLDDLEEHTTVFRQDLKRLGKRFKKELEYTVNKIYENITKEENNNFIACYDDYSSILFQLDKLNVHERKRLEKVLPNLVKKLQLDKQLEITVKKIP